MMVFGSVLISTLLPSCALIYYVCKKLFYTLYYYDFGICQVYLIFVKYIVNI